MTPIYLDYQATAPLCPEAARAMVPWLDFRTAANPHSAHSHGYRAHAAVEGARAAVAHVIGAQPDTVRFTSGATEANNWALFGTMTRPGQTRRRIVTLATEHSCVLEAGRALERLGAELTIVPVGADGIVDPDAVAAAMGDDVAILSAMLVNNEIGVIQPVMRLAALAHAAGALFHCDAAQAYGKLALDADALGIDLMSISSHKAYGPPGIGALYVRPGIDIAPILYGGAQEKGRSGTVPVALAAGFGAAALTALGRMREDAAHVEALWTSALARLEAPHRINGSETARWRGNLNLSFPGVDGARLLSEVTRTVSVSSGSACAAASGRDSHVLAAIGVPKAEARATIRLGWGRFTTDADVCAAMAAINAAAVGAARLAA